MIYENRERLKAVAKELGKYATAPSGFDADVEKQRRLEHFDNKVILLNKDTSLPVSAELSWVKGQNILSIYANIRFIKMRGQTNTEARKKAALDGFLKWEGMQRKQIAGSNRLSETITGLLFANAGEENDYN